MKRRSFLRFLGLAPAAALAAEKVPEYCEGMARPADKAQCPPANPPVENELYPVYESGAFDGDFSLYATACAFTSTAYSHPHALVIRKENVTK